MEEINQGLHAHTRPYVDWSFEVSPTHSHHKHPAPLTPARTPARKPQLVLGQGEDEDQQRGGGEVYNESGQGDEKGCMHEGDGGASCDSDGDGGGEGEGQGESGVRLMLKVVRVRGR